MNDGMVAPASLLREVPRTALTALAGTEQRQPIVIVLGMHRSGTSLCSHVLSALGVDMTDKVAGPGHEAPAFDNPKGHWERWEIVDFHDRILALFNRGYFTPFHDFVFPAAWWADPGVAEVRREIIAFLEKRMVNGYFGFKDPRTARLMPMWHQIVNELKLAAKIVNCLRNPAQVARSLQARDRLDVEIGEYRWLAYNVDFFRYTKASDICTIEYEAWFDDPASNLAKLRNFLDLPEYHRDFDMDLAISGIIDNQLRHDEAHIGEASQPLIRSVYKLARRADHDPAAREQVQNIAAQFLTFQQLQRVFQREFEQTAASAARVPALEQDAAALRASLSEREAHLEGAAGQAQATAAQHAEALAELDRQRAQIIDLVNERDSAAAALDAARASIEMERSALVQSEHRVGELEAALGEREAAVTALQAEMAGLCYRLAEAERQVQEREAAAAAEQHEMARLGNALVLAEQEIREHAGTIETMRAEFLAVGDQTRREALARAGHEAQQRAMAAAAVEAEMAWLRERLAEAEGEAREREGANAALQGEISAMGDSLTQAEQERNVTAEEVASLQSALATARQVGQAAVKALAADVPAVISRDERIGWWRAMKRRFGFAGTA